MTVTPQIFSCDLGGVHNSNLNKSITRLDRAGQYKDLSTIIISPGFGSMPTKCVASWLNMFSPPNAKIARLFPMNLEVGEAFSQTIENIIEHPEFKNWKYILTLEHDNAPPSDGLVKLLEHAENHPEFAAIGGLYWTKGANGVPQIWGDPKSADMNFRPQKPVAENSKEQLVECRGTGMGFTLFRIKMFQDPKLRRPWFKTISSKEEGVGTQDLYFWNDAQKHGYRCAIACDVKVGHYDLEGKFGPSDTMW